MASTTKNPATRGDAGRARNLVRFAAETGFEIANFAFDFQSKNVATAFASIDPAALVALGAASHAVTNASVLVTLSAFVIGEVLQ